jgi:hypothetical protein
MKRVTATTISQNECCKAGRAFWMLKKACELHCDFPWTRFLDAHYSEVNLDGLCIKHSDISISPELKACQQTASSFAFDWRSRPIMLSSLLPLATRK